MLRDEQPDELDCIVLVFIALLVGTLVGSALTAHAQEPDARLTAARVCYLEASFRETDCVALLWVASKRAKQAGCELEEMLLAYSAIDANTARAREVRTYGWGDVPGMPARWNARWLKLRELVTDVLAGEYKDPCPRAMHWGGKMDSAKPGMVPARCAAATANTFYAVRR